MEAKYKKGDLVWNKKEVRADVFSSYAPNSLGYMWVDRCGTFYPFYESEIEPYIGQDKTLNETLYKRLIRQMKDMEHNDRKNFIKTYREVSDNVDDESGPDSINDKIYKYLKENLSIAIYTHARGFEIKLYLNRDVICEADSE